MDIAGTDGRGRKRRVYILVFVIGHQMIGLYGEVVGYSFKMFMFQFTVKFASPSPDVSKSKILKIKNTGQHRYSPVADIVTTACSQYRSSHPSPFITFKVEFLESTVNTAFSGGTPGNITKNIGNIATQKMKIGILALYV